MTATYLQMYMINKLQEMKIKCLPSISSKEQFPKFNYFFLLFKEKLILNFDNWIYRKEMIQY